ncbi:MAG: recombination mediator RecR [Candidatus Gracilibacteria bacterium]|nr:recombination mediator RecR [Candidatus Gracilibacteria bacterium]
MPESLKKLIDIISFLPGIGEKTATKLAFFLLKANTSYINNFANYLQKIKKEIHECKKCYAYTDSKNEFCPICKDSSRDKNVICVIEDYLDLISIEKLKIYNGIYHVLGGAISPMSGIGINDLKIKELLQRIENNDIIEIILATNPNIEGEATAMYIRENIKKDITVSRLSKGLPSSGYIEYADEITLINSFKGRS